MAKQNIYDNDTFFESYKDLRDNKVNANDMVEIPALFSLLPELKGKHVLDMGCGYGGHCKKVVELGADKVLGIDISKKMLEVAIDKNTNSKIDFKRMAMEDLSELDASFDVVISSLALHYIEDFKAVTDEVYRLLDKGGYFIFSQEHPLNTCFNYGDRWTRDEHGKKMFANVSEYSIDGRRESSWFIEGVVKYHRTFASIMNTLIESGFTIERVVEPIPDIGGTSDLARDRDGIHKPDFLLIKAYK